MKKLLFVISALLCVGSISAQSQLSVYEEVEHYIEVTGCSEVTLTPDIFYVVININESDSKGRISASEQQEKMIKELDKARINTSKQLKLNSMQLSFEKRKTAYSSVSYTLKLTSEESLLKAFEIFDELYISDVYLERTESSKMKSARKEARKEAVKNAEECAEELADALNQKLGGCFYIYDMSNDDNYPVYVRSSYAAKGFNGAAEADAVEKAPLEVKEIKVNYRVRTKFWLKM